MNFRIERARTVTTVFLSGDMKESIGPRLNELFDQITTPEVILDFHDFGFANSVGISLWCRFVGRLDEKCRIEHRRVPALLIHYAGLISNFFGKAKLRSFYVPFFCEPCETPTDVLIDTEVFKTKGQIAPAPCPRCGKTMKPLPQFDDYVETLLACLGNLL